MEKTNEQTLNDVAALLVGVMERVNGMFRR